MKRHEVGSVVAAESAVAAAVVVVVAAAAVVERVAKVSAEFVRLWEQLVEVDFVEDVRPYSFCPDKTGKD